MFSESLIRLKGKKPYAGDKNCNSPQGSRIVIDKKEYINFSSNNYLGLANHPHVTESAQKAIAMFGFGSGASRLLCGGSILHDKLEKRQQNSREQNQPLSLIQAILQTQG